MVDFEQFTSWLIVALFIVSVAVLLTRQPRQGLLDRFERLTEWSARRAAADPEFDDDPAEYAELREILRNEKLYADLDRLRHLLATDEGMSATRQFGNRLAYARLLDDLARRRSADLVAPVGPAVGSPASAVLLSRASAGPESLDVRWR